MKEKFIENNIKYILAEDGIYYPNLKLPEDNETRPIGLYGSLRRIYLKNHRPALFMDFLLSGTLTRHLAGTNESAHERIELIIKQITEHQGINVPLKASDWLKWVQSMNNIYNVAQEIVLNEMIYI